MYNEHIKHSQINPALTMALIIQLCMLIDFPHTNSPGAISRFHYNPSGCPLITIQNQYSEDVLGSKVPNYDLQLDDFLILAQNSSFNETEFLDILNVFEEKMRNFFPTTDKEPLWQMSHQLHEALKSVKLNEELFESVFGQYITVDKDGFQPVDQYYEVDLSPLEEPLHSLRELAAKQGLTRNGVTASICESIASQYTMIFGDTVSKRNEPFPSGFSVNCTSICCSSTNSSVEQWFMNALRAIFTNFYSASVSDFISEKLPPSSSRVVIKHGDTLIAGTTTHGSVFGSTIPYRKGYRNNLSGFGDISSRYPFFDVQHIFQAPDGSKYVFLGNGGSFRRSGDILRLTHIIMQHLIFGNSLFNTLQCIEKERLVEETLQQVVNKTTSKSDLLDNLPDDGVLIRFSQNAETEIFHFGMKKAAKAVTPFLTA